VDVGQHCCVKGDFEPFSGTFDRLGLRFQGRLDRLDLGGDAGEDSILRQSSWHSPGTVFRTFNARAELWSGKGIDSR
jgi:hypothetical protein